MPGSRHAFVGDLAERPESFLAGGGDPPDEGGPWWVACATGHRASLAASVLDRAGVAVRLVGRGGIPRLLRTCPDLAAALI